MAQLVLSLDQSVHTHAETARLFLPRGCAQLSGCPPGQTATVFGIVTSVVAGRGHVGSRVYVSLSAPDGAVQTAVATSPPTSLGKTAHFHAEYGSDVCLAPDSTAIFAAHT